MAAENIREGTDVYFDCRVHARPIAYKVEWRHNVSSLRFLKIISIKNLLVSRPNSTGDTVEIFQSFEAFINKDVAARKLQNRSKSLERTSIALS